MSSGTAITWLRPSGLFADIERNTGSIVAQHGDGRAPGGRLRLVTPRAAARIAAWTIRRRSLPLACRTMTTLPKPAMLQPSLADHAPVRAAEPETAECTPMITPSSCSSPTPSSVAASVVDEAVARALDEDPAAPATSPRSQRFLKRPSSAVMVARARPAIAGLPLAVATLRFAPDIRIEAHVRDGDAAAGRPKIADHFRPGAGGAFGRAHGAQLRRSLSGIATLTADYVKRTDGTRRGSVARARPRRDCGRWKNMPCVAAGIQPSLRLDDAILIMITTLRGGRRRSRGAGTRPQPCRLSVRIEIEVDTIDQLREVLDTGLPMW